MYLSLVYFVTGLLGFLTFSVVVTQYRSNRKVNSYLLILFFFSASRYLFNGIHILIPFRINEDVMITLRSFGCLIFPCIYLYFRNLIANRKHFIKEDFLYFIPPILFGFTNLLIRKYAISLHIIVYFLFAAIASYYLILSYLELKNKLWSRQSTVAIVDKQKGLIRNWTIFFFVLCCLCISRLLITLFLDIYIAGYSDGTSYFWVAAILSCILYFKILLTPVDLHAGITINHKEKKEYFELVFEDFWIVSDSVLVENCQDLKLKERMDANLVSYIHEIERMALKQFYFRKSSVCMRDFAIILGIPKSHLIYIFKYHSNVNFFEFKKTVRIYDAICLIEAGFLKSNALMCLSKKIGFSSCNLFLISFKEITGVVPQEYNKMIKE